MKKITIVGHDGTLHRLPGDTPPDKIKIIREGVPMEASECDIDEKTLSVIQSMRKDALISLIQRVSGAMWGVGLQTEEQTAEAMLLKLAINGLTSQDNKDALANINAWLDRKRGKPAQTQVVDMNVKGEVEHTLRLEMTADMVRENVDRILKKRVTAVDNG